MPTWPLLKLCGKCAPLIQVGYNRAIDNDIIGLDQEQFVDNTVPISKSLCGNTLFYVSMQVEKSSQSTSTVFKDLLRSPWSTRGRLRSTTD